MRRFWACLTVLFAVGPSWTQSVTIKGSTTLLPAAEQWASNYSASKPGVTVKALGGGSGTGFQALSANTADLAASSRKIEPKETADITAKRGKAPEEFKVAIDGVAIFVNKNNPLEKLTVAQLADILSGKVTNWSEVGGAKAPIHIFGRDTNSGTYGFVKEHVLKGGNFAAGAGAAPSSTQIIGQIGGDAGGIGYGSIEFGKGIKHLSISASADSPAVKPDLSTIRSGDYPLTRGLFLYSAGSPSPAVRDFVLYVVSDKGQAVASDVGLFSLSAKDKAKAAAALK